jgi:RNA polymerase sigma factor (sigma-70 family)
MDDLQLLRAYAERGDLSAFNVLVQRHRPAVLAICWRKLASFSDAEDATQEVFMALLSQASQVHTNVGTWLHQCAVNVANAMLRNGKRRVRVESEKALLSSDFAGGDPVLLERIAILDAFLKELDSDDQRILLQNYIQENTQEEIAAELGVSQQTVSRRISRIVEGLRNSLRQRGVLAPVAVMLILTFRRVTYAVVPQRILSLFSQAGGPSAPSPDSALKVATTLKLAAATLIFISAVEFQRQSLQSAAAISADTRESSASSLQALASVPDSAKLAPNARGSLATGSRFGMVNNPIRNTDTAGASQWNMIMGGALPGFMTTDTSRGRTISPFVAALSAKAASPLNQSAGPAPLPLAEPSFAQTSWEFTQITNNVSKNLLAATAKDPEARTPRNPIGPPDSSFMAVIAALFSKQFPPAPDFEKPWNAYASFFDPLRAPHSIRMNFLRAANSPFVAATNTLDFPLRESFDSGERAKSRGETISQEIPATSFTAATTTGNADPTKSADSSWLPLDATTPPVPLTTTAGTVPPPRPRNIIVPFPPQGTAALAGDKTTSPSDTLYLAGYAAMLNQDPTLTPEGLIKLWQLGTNEPTLGPPDWRFAPQMVDLSFAIFGVDMPPPTSPIFLNIASAYSPPPFESLATYSDFAFLPAGSDSNEVPEPTTAVLLFPAVLVLMARRPRNTLK